MKKILIIGAGPAGLTAGYEILKKENASVIIIEKDEQIGGISKTVSFNEKYLVDTGIHRFFSKSEQINQIWKEILPDDMLKKDRYTRIYYEKKFYKYPVELNIETIKNLGFLRICKVFFSYIKAQIFKREEKSLEDFYINKFGKVLYSIFFENYTEKVWGIHPQKIDADWGAQRVKGISLFEVIKDYFKKILKVKNNKNSQTSLIDNFLYPKLGAGQMWETMANKIKDMGGKIITSSEVEGLILKDGQIRQVEYSKNKEKHIEDVDIVISSMPIKDLVNDIKGEIPPKEIINISINLPYRDFMSVCMVVKKINLKNNTNIKTIGDIIPDNWIYVQEPDVKMGRMQIFNNWSPYLFKDENWVKDRVLISFEYFCNQDDEYWNMSDEEFIEFAKKEAIKIGIINENDYIEGKRIKIEKAYPAYFGTYKEIDKVIKYLNSIDNLYCIGRNGQHRYNNMDHSMLTGIETAKKIINNDKTKEEIWKVNTEKEYHEK